MKIEERIQEAITKTETSLNSNPEFVKLRDFYLEMQEAGIAQKQEYTLPPLDTSGRRLHEMTISKTTKK
jgi:hypothetical protein